MLKSELQKGRYTQETKRESYIPWFIPLMVRMTSPEPGARRFIQVSQGQCETIYCIAMTCVYLISQLLGHIK